MGIESLPLIMFLLLPGFLSWFIFCWGTVTRKISQLQHFFASLILSIIAFTIDYGAIYLAKLATNTLASFPTYAQILTDPEVLPPELGVAIYPTAICIGFLLIRAYKSKGVRELLGRVGLDLYGHEDVWYRAFRRHDYITVHLKDGSIVAGWPTYYSKTGGSENTELYLQKIHYYQKEQDRWVKPSKSVEGLLLNMTMISHIEFRRPEEEDKTTQRSVEPPTVLSGIDYLRMGMLLCSFGLILFSIRARIPGYGIAGPILVVFSLMFMSAALWEKPRNAINRVMARQRNPLIRNLPRLFEWYILVAVFTSGFVHGLLSPPLPNAAMFVALYVVGVAWMFVSINQLIPRARHT